MSRRRALPATDELRAMAKMVAEFGVQFRGRTDADGVTRWSMAPAAIASNGNDGGDDFDDRLSEFASR